MESLIKNRIMENKTNTSKTTPNKSQARDRLLRAAIIYASNLNEEELRNISIQLGTITNEDFMYMDKLILNSFNHEQAEMTTELLSKNVKGFKQAHNIYYYALCNI